MISNDILRSSLDEVAKKLSKKGFSLDKDYYKELEQNRKEIQGVCEKMQSELNTKSKTIGQLVAAGKSIDAAKNELGQLSKKVKDSENELRTHREKIKDFMLAIPNIPHDDVPDGQSEEDNIEVLRHGDIRSFEFPIKDHVALGEGLGGMLFKEGATLSGSRFVVLSGAIAHLHRALSQFMLDFHINQHGYTELNVPVLVNPKSLVGTGQLPKFEEDLFFLRDDSYGLIPTAEVPLTNMVQGKVIHSEHLPIKYVCHSLCFRREAGAYGKDTHGMIRMHQFEKVELVQIVRKGAGIKALAELTLHAESILQALKLPYRKVSLCGGDLGFSAELTYDLEVWLPGQANYREISSCSSFGDFQARRVLAREKCDGANQYVETINGSGLAIGRALIAVMENYQNSDGSITIPNVLRPYMGNLETIS